MGSALWRLLVTTDVGREQWTRWEVLDTVFPYDQGVRVRVFDRKGVLLVWSSLESNNLLQLLVGRLTRARRLVRFDDSCSCKLRDIVYSAKRIVGGFRNFKVKSEVRGGYLCMGCEELSNAVSVELGCLGGIETLLIEVVWDVVGLSFSRLGKLSERAARAPRKDFNPSGGEGTISKSHLIREGT
ncbi:MAG: hypothetical protein QFX33_02650 [Candidatus Nezhaarchaeota archaeon]|nr:hypothetical protein [Candidatus Nezhaarchaeota archaeon]